MAKPRNCRHCSFMVCGDANWCSEYEILRTDCEIQVHTDCSLFEWNPIDVLTLIEWEEHMPVLRRPVLDEQMTMELRGDAE